MQIDINSSQEINKEQSENNCPVHETELTDGFCELCAICYSCEGHN